MHRIRLALAIFLLWFSPYTYVPILSTYAASVGSSLAMAGMILGSYGFVQLILRIPIGVLSDRLGTRGRFLRLAFGVGILSQLIFLGVPHSPALLLARSLAGLSVAHWAVFIRVFQDVDRPDRTPAQAIGTVSVYQAAGTLFGMMVGGMVADRRGARATFLLGAVTAAAGWVLVSGRIGAPRRAEGGAAISVRAILAGLRNRRLLVYSLLTALMQVIVASTLTGFMPTVLSDLGASETQIALATTLAAIPAVFGGPLALGPLMRRWGLTGTAVLGFGLLALGTYPFAVRTSVPLLIGAATVAGVGKGLLGPLLMAASTRDVAPDRRSTALSAHQALYSIGMSLGPAVTGVYSQATTVAAAYRLLAVIGLLGAGLMVAVRRRV